MPNYTATTTITTDRGESLSASKTGTYEEVFNVRQEVDNSNTFIDLISASNTKATSTLNDCKSLIIKNPSNTAAEIQIKTKEWADATPDSNGGTDSMQLILLSAGEHIYLPSFRQLNFQADANSGGAAYQLTNQAPDSNMYVAVNNPAGGDAQLLDEGSNITNSVTNFTVDDGDFFKAGDLIRLDNEIMEVTSVDGNELYVIRGTHGSAKATHNDDVALRFAFFNAYADFDKYSVSQTDASGRFKCSNFFGYARTEGEADGIVPGSFSMKFYNAGYQELGMSGITPSTKTGLAASTAYAFDIAVDGGSDHTLSFTTDSSNGNFGGRNGLIQKIQDALDVQFYTTSSNLISKKITVGIVGGDIRFTSGQHLSTSAIAISAPNSGTTPFGVGAFTMAVGDIEAAVAARLPDDTITDTKTGVSSPNVGAFAYDDGHGIIQGACVGTINYETGAIDIQGCPPNAEFVFDANYGSAHSGGNDFGASTANSLLSVGARCCNSKINSTVEVIGLK
jgi:hypothetical protein